MKTVWRVEGIYKADAEKVRNEIGDVKTTPQEIVKKARDETTELHKCFEWDDSIAAEKYRLQQARQILSMLVFEKEEKKEPKVRVFSLTMEKGTYQPTTLFISQPDEYQSLLDKALADFEAYRKKYATLTELQPLFEAYSEL